jgi:hypothetical protein
MMMSSLPAADRPRHLPPPPLQPLSLSTTLHSLLRSNRAGRAQVFDVAEEARAAGQALSESVRGRLDQTREGLPPPLSLVLGGHAASLTPY